MDKKISDTACIRTFASRTQAEVARSILDAQGIKSFVAGDDAGGMYPPLIGGIKLIVSTKDKKKAMEVINI